MEHGVGIAVLVVGNHVLALLTQYLDTFRPVVAAHFVAAAHYLVVQQFDQRLTYHGVAMGLLVFVERVASCLVEGGQTGVLQVTGMAYGVVSGTLSGLPFLLFVVVIPTCSTCNEHDDGSDDKRFFHFRVLF